MNVFIQNFKADDGGDVPHDSMDVDESRAEPQSVFNEAFVYARS